MAFDDPSEARVVAGLRALARASAGARPPGALEATLLAEFDRHHDGRRGERRRNEWRACALAAAAVLVVAAGLSLAQRDLSSPVDRSAVVDGSSEFVPWPGAAALPAFESGQLVRTELPASVLPLLGIPQADAPEGGYVTADVLYAQDGLARAVRIVRNQSMQP